MNTLIASRDLLFNPMIGDQLLSNTGNKITVTKIQIQYVSDAVYCTVYIFVRKPDGTSPGEINMRLEDYHIAFAEASIIYAAGFNP